MASGWHLAFHRFCNRVYFARITLVHGERLPGSGPVLYLGLHRNGAVDGFVYHSVLPRAQFMISTQLRRNPLGRLFFAGIEVVRGKDEGDPAINDAALKECARLLASGGELFVFPEGTSSLGPRHLPFKSGAVQLLDASLQNGIPVTVVPVGIHYECPWAFRSKVEVVIGTPVPVTLPPGLTPIGRIKELKRRIKTGLESVGINVESVERQETIQRLAYVATLGADRSYYKTLKTIETSVPEAILAAWKSLETRVAPAGLLTHQGVPLFPLGPVWLYALALLPFGLMTGAAILLNLPPFAVAWWAGCKFPDDRNVISLWRILVGIPLFILWILLLTVVAIVTGALVWWMCYALITMAGLWGYYRTKKLAVAVHNCLHAPSLRREALAFRELVLKEVPDEA